MNIWHVIGGAAKLPMHGDATWNPNQDMRSKAAAANLHVISATSDDSDPMSKRNISQPGAPVDS